MTTWAVVIAPWVEETVPKAEHAEVSRRATYPLVGLVLALGAPAGLLLVKWITAGLPAMREFVAGELASSMLTYVYALISTSVVFALLGTKLGAQEDSLLQASMTDPLTGIPNRRHFNDRLGHELARSRRYHVPTSLLIIDIDGLKGINDAQGHESGDRVLSAVARAIRSTIRGVDVVARIGGDEYGVIMPLTEAHEAERLAERVRESVERLGRPSHRIAVSIGVADLERSLGNTPTELFAAADRALYAAKSAGRNQVHTAESLSRSHDRQMSSPTNDFKGEPR